jgi:hypothetical protein
VIDRYDWSGGSEAMIRFGPPRAPVVLMALPFFEEANRTRTFAISILRAIGELGLVGALPDLPGTGESLLPTEHATLEMWRHAFGGASDHIACHGPLYVASIRSGALLLDETFAFAAWQLAPMTGREVIRELTRVEAAAGSSRESVPAGTPIEIAGNLVSVEMLRQLKTAMPYDMKHRVVRLATDPREADVKFAGSPLWRRPEPDNDLALARTFAGDIVDWVRRCEG